MGELFDRFVAVDWSAAGRPARGPDSIWIGAGDGQEDAPVRLSNPPTRRAAERELRELVSGRLRTLLAIDVSLGYPAGTSEVFALGGEIPWRATWAHVADRLVDDESNRNDRFALAAELNRRADGEGPFWGCPTGSTYPGLPPRRPATSALARFRRTEERLIDAGRRPSSGWQLLGAGTVGSQTLTALPVLHRLLVDGLAEIWPFTTGLGLPTTAGSAIVAETWPTAFDLDLRDAPVRDAAQVGGVVDRLREADVSGELASWFAPPVTAAERAVAEREEGWILSPPASIPGARSGAAPGVAGVGMGIVSNTRSRRV